jgi:hypothetical protein
MIGYKYEIFLFSIQEASISKVRPKTGSVKGSYILISLIAVEKQYERYDKTSHYCFHSGFSFTATEIQGTILDS